MQKKLREKILNIRKLDSDSKNLLLDIIKKNNILKNKEIKLNKYLDSIKIIINNFFYSINNIKKFSFNIENFDYLNKNIKNLEDLLKDKKFFNNNKPNIKIKSKFYINKNNNSEENEYIKYNNYRSNLSQNLDLNQSNKEFLSNNILSSESFEEENFQNISQKIDINIMEELINDQQKSIKNINVNDIDSVKEKIKNDEILIDIMNSFHSLNSKNKI